MSEKRSCSYSKLSNHHKRKIIAVNRIGDIALNYIASQGNNNLVRMIQRNAFSFANNLSDEEVDKAMIHLDQLVEEAKGKDARVNIADSNRQSKKTRSLFR